MVEKGDDRLGRAGREARRLVREDPVERARGDAVDVLRGVEGGTGGVLVERSGERPEHEAAMDGRVPVHPGDDVHELSLGAVGREDEPAHVDADLRAALLGAPLVGEVVIALAHAHDGKRRRHAARGQGLDAGNESLGDGGRDGRAPEELRHGYSPPLMDLVTWATTASARGRHSARRASHSASTDAA